MQSSAIICPECGGENRPGTARCVHCALLFDDNRKPLTDFRQLKDDLEEMRVANEAAALRKQKAEERAAAEELRGKVLPQDEAPVIQMEGVPFPWQKYLGYAVAAALIIFLGFFAYRTLFPAPELYGTLNNFTERSGSPLFKQVIAVSSKEDYGRVQESMIENSELFDTLVGNGSARLLPNGTRVKIIEASMPYSCIECEGQKWYVLSDYLTADSGEEAAEAVADDAPAVPEESWE